MQLERELGAPSSLRQIGLPEDELARAAELVAAALGRLPGAVSRASSDALVQAAFDGSWPTVGVR